MLIPPTVEHRAMRNSHKHALNAFSEEKEISMIFSLGYLHSYIQSSLVIIANTWRSPESENRKMGRNVIETAKYYSAIKWR